MNIIIPFNIKITIFDEDKPLTQKQIKTQNLQIDSLIILKLISQTRIL